MTDERKAIDRAREKLKVERNNMHAMAAARETILNAKEKEIDAWQMRQNFADRAQGLVDEMRKIDAWPMRQNFADRAQALADEMRKIVESSPVEIVKFKTPIKNLGERIAADTLRQANEQLDNPDDEPEPGGLMACNPEIIGKIDGHSHRGKYAHEIKTGRNYTGPSGGFHIDGK